MNTNKTYYCVWSEQGTILCLTTDYGIAVDVYGEHMIFSGKLTDDDWATSAANIEEFSELPTNREDIVGELPPDAITAWKHGDTVLLNK